MSEIWHTICLASKVCCRGAVPRSSRLTLLPTTHRDHPLLRPIKIHVRPSRPIDLTESWLAPNGGASLACSIRSGDKRGRLVDGLEIVTGGQLQVEASAPFVAPAPGQMAVLYQELSTTVRIVRSCGPIVSAGLEREKENLE